MDRRTTTRWEATTQPDDVTARLLALLFGDEPKREAPARALRRREVA